MISKSRRKKWHVLIGLLTMIGLFLATIKISPVEFGMFLFLLIRRIKAQFSWKIRWCVFLESINIKLSK